MSSRIPIVTLMAATWLGCTAVPPLEESTPALELTTVQRVQGDGLLLVATLHARVDVDAVPAVTFDARCAVDERVYLATGLATFEHDVSSLRAGGTYPLRVSLFDDLSWQRAGFSPSACEVSVDLLSQVAETRGARWCFEGGVVLRGACHGVPSARSRIPSITLIGHPKFVVNGTDELRFEFDVIPGPDGAPRFDARLRCSLDGTQKDVFVSVPQTTGFVPGRRRKVAALGRWLEPALPESCELEVATGAAYADGARFCWDQNIGLRGVSIDRPC